MMELLERKSSKKQTKAVQEVLNDFWICCVSREASIFARRDVLGGKGGFGITGDGKEVAQVAFAKMFKKGDHRSGYYRDQTFMMALGLMSVEQFFAQLYADPLNDKFSGGRQMNNHFATKYINEDGTWVDQKDEYNISADTPCTAGQVARGLGLALASKKYREVKKLNNTKFSNKGNEVVFMTIGDASTSEGPFWETVNAAGVLQVPIAFSIWDDGYGISVPKKYQTTKESISELLSGFKIRKGTNGIDVYYAKGWDYPALIEMYKKGIAKTRKQHVPSYYHVDEITQPLGHSTSGSHERYKSKERLQWEKDHDCIVKMGDWMVSEGMVSNEEIAEIRKEAREFAKKAKLKAWKAFMEPTNKDKAELIAIFDQILEQNPTDIAVELRNELVKDREPLFHDILRYARRMNIELLNSNIPARTELKNWIETSSNTGQHRYSDHLLDDNEQSALNVPAVDAVYSDASETLPGYSVLNKYFDEMFSRHDNLFAFGEDVGNIGDVNQGLAGLQKKYGEERIFDTGIREWTIMGQGIGMAMRGLRPIAEIQYLDYLVYGLAPLTDDLATLRYRSNNIQAAPLIVRTRGHRLEGIWHSGSPMMMLLGSLRGIHLCVPRNMVQAAGFYNTLLAANDPGLVIEPLNGYRLRQTAPDNLFDFNVPLGVPEVLNEGSDVTLVTYGSCVRIAEVAVELLEKVGISVELIDVQTLMPFDLENRIGESLQKTNRIVFLDEDVPGGASAYMMQKVIESNEGFYDLDQPAMTISAQAHRPAYGPDGDYFSKPNSEDVFEKIYMMMHEDNPTQFPEI